MSEIPAARVALTGDKPPTVPWLRWFQALARRSPRFGSATFSAGTSIAVTLVPEEATDTYAVALEPSENNTFWISSKAVGGFTLNAASTSSATVPFVIHRR